MYKKSSRAIKAEFRKNFDALPRDFDQGIASITSRIREDFDILIDNYTLKRDKMAVEASEVEAKTELQKQVNSLFANFETAWAHKMKFAEPIDEDELEEIDFKVEDLTKDDDKEDSDFEISDGETGE